VKKAAQDYAIDYDFSWLLQLIYCGRITISAIKNIERAFGPAVIRGEIERLEDTRRYGLRSV